MLTDLIYAQKQLDRAKQFCVERGARDCIDRAWDALERCMEEEQARLDTQAEVDAELEALFADDGLTDAELVLVEQIDWTPEEILRREG